MVFLDNFYFVFSFLKSLGGLLLLMGLMILLFFISFYKFKALSLELSDFFFLYWFSGWPTSSIIKKWGNYSKFESFWLEFFGPKIGFNLSFSSIYLNTFENSFYKIVYLFLGVLIVFFLFFSLFFS
jgi:hypothetical protein